MTDDRKQRLAADLAALRALEAASSILVVEAMGKEPERYTITFRGRGLRRNPTNGHLELVDDHRCVIRVPMAYPQQPPDIQWLTPIVHPNISFSGLLQLDELGLPWSESYGLDVVCERLWDATRLAYVDWDQVVNTGARQSLQNECCWHLPLDARPLRDRETREVRNIVKYRRHGEPAGSRSADEMDHDILVINEQTAAPAESITRNPPRSDHEIFYIGDDELL